MYKYFTELVDFVGSRPKPFNNTKKYISTGALKTNNISEDDVEMIDYATRPSRADLEVKTGDILFAKMAFTDKRLLVGDIEANYIYSTGFFAVKPKEGILTSQCLFYLLNSESFRNQKDINSTGATQKAITIEGLKKISLRIPEYHRQNQIGMTLENIDKVIKLKEQQLSEYDQLIKSRFVEMFEHVDLNKSKSDWVKLGECTEIITGTTPSTRVESNWGGSHLWITPAELNDNSFFIKDTKRKLTDAGLKSKSLSVMPIDTVLLSTRAPIGKVAIVGSPMSCNQGFKNFICNDSLNPIYLYSLLKYNKDYLNSIGTGTTFTEISKTAVSNIVIPVPNITLQNDFAKFVEQIDKLKFEDDVLPDKLREIRLLHIL